MKTWSISNDAYACPAFPKFTKFWTSHSDTAGAKTCNLTLGDASGGRRCEQTLEFILPGNAVRLWGTKLDEADLNACGFRTRWSTDFGDEAFSRKTGA